MQSSALSIWSTKYSARRDLRLQLISGKSNSTNGETQSYNVLDPLTRQSYRIGELERLLLELLNGQRTTAQVFSLLRSGPEYQAPLLTEARFLTVIEHFRNSGLIRVPRSLNSATSPIARAQSLLSSFVVWQLRGVQPDAWLTKLAPRTGAIFSGAAVRFWLLFAAFTTCGVGFEFQRLAQHGSAWQWIVHPVHGSALFIVFLLTRAAHELGHALVCKRHGVRCPDIGVFVILGAPCVYCDVTESWHLPSRRQRAAVAAAGMYVELIVATLAAWVWMLTVDGPVNKVALQTMFVCSVSTLLINANPLMRFDGYYLLSDLLDDPNLRGRADQIALARIYRWVLGYQADSAPKAPLNTHENLLCLFSWSSWIYRAGLSLAIASVLATIYASWNLAWLGRLIAVSILASWWGVPSVKFASEIAKIAWRTNTSWRLAAVTATGVIGAAILPIPYRQFARGWVQPADMQGVYVSIADQSADGLTQLEGCIIAPGTTVEAGQALFQLDNLQIKRAARTSAAENERAQVQLAAQKKESLSSEQTELRQKDLSELETAAKNAAAQVEQAEEDVKRLTLRAPTAGRLIVMPVSRTVGPGEHAANLMTQYWDDNTQLQSHVPKGTILAAVCSPQQVAVLPLADEQLEWIAAGTEVRLRCADRMDQVYKCKVASVVRLEEATATRRLIDTNLAETSNSGGSVATASNGSAKAAYAAFVELPEGVASPVGAAVDGSFVAPSQTLASIGYRWLNKNLRWLAD